MSEQTCKADNVQWMYGCSAIISDTWHITLQQMVCNVVQAEMQLMRLPCQDLRYKERREGTGVEAFEPSICLDGAGATHELACVEAVWKEQREGFPRSHKSVLENYVVLLLGDKPSINNVCF